MRQDRIDTAIGLIEKICNRVLTRPTTTAIKWKFNGGSTLSANAYELIVVMFKVFSSTHTVPSEPCQTFTKLVSNARTALLSSGVFGPHPAKEVIAPATSTKLISIQK